MNFRAALVCIHILGIMPFMRSQSVVISNLTTSSLQICQRSEFIYQINNESIELIDDAELVLELPEGVQYIPSSSLSAEEVNISNLQRPVFSIDLMPGSIVQWNFELTCDCRVYDGVQQGDFFINKINLNHTKVDVEYVDDPPYPIQTALLVIQPITDNKYVSGVQSERELRITNTRLGRIDRMILTHSHDPLRIENQLGQVVSQNNQMLVVELDGDDFQSVGNGDEFLDPNETWIHRETLIHEKCIDEILNSEYTVSWGCEAVTCQSDTFASQMIFNLTTERSGLRITENWNFPDCTCDPAGQCMIIKNIRGAATDSTHFWFTYGDSLDRSRGIEANSFFIKNGNVQIDSVLHRENKNLDCATGSYTYRSDLYLSNVFPGEEFELCFTLQSCVDTLAYADSIAQLKWVYGYDYGTLCRPDAREVNRGKTIIMDNQVPTSKWSWEGATLQLETDTNLIAEWTVEGGQLRNSGRLSFSLCHPCMLDYPGDFQISNNAPVWYVDTFRRPGVTEYVYHFQLPFPEDQVTATASLNFSCEATCLDSIAENIVGRFITSCPEPQGFGSSLNFSVSGGTYFSPCPADKLCTYFTGSCAAAAARCRLGRKSAEIPAYMDFDGVSFRENYGERDNDDDRRSNGGIADSSMANAFKFTYGDTMLSKFAGTIRVDQPGTYDSLAFMVSPGFRFTLIDGIFRFKDGQTGEEWECTFTDGKIIGESSPPPPCCGYVVSKDFLPLSGVFWVTPESLSDAGCPQPNFRVEPGDSVFMELRLSSITHAEVPFNSDVVQRMEIYDRTRPINRFTCGVAVTPIEHSSMVIQFNPIGKFEYDACNTQPLNGGWLFDPTPMSDNFFEKEFRHQIVFELAEWRVSDGLKIDSVRISQVYRSGSNFDTLSQRIIATEFQDDVYSLADSSVNNLIVDEGAQMFFEPFVEVRSCEDVRKRPNITMQLNWRGKGDFQFGLEPFGFLARPSVALPSSKTASIKKTEIEVVSGGSVIFGFDSVFCANFIVKATDGLDGFFITSSTNSNPQLNHQVRTEDEVILNLIENGVTTCSWSESGDYEIQVCYPNLSCEDDSMNIEMFWTCEGDQVGEKCFQDSFSFEIKKSIAELELDVVSKEERIDLCDTSERVTLDLYNAELGTAYDLKLKIMRATGLEIIPSTLEYSYPAGSAWRSAPLSANFNGLSLEWNISELPEIEMGLPGISKEPENRLMIRFKSQTTCDYSSGSFYTFEFSGIGPCLEKTNEVSKTSQPLFINNVPARQIQEIRSSVRASDCSDESEIKVVILHNSPSQGGEIIDIATNINDELSVVDLDFVRNISSAGLDQDTSGSTIIFRLINSQPVLAGDSSIFTFTLIGLDRLRCGEATINIQSKSVSDQFCTTIGENCEAAVTHSSQLITIEIPGIHVNLDSFRISKGLDSCIWITTSTLFSHKELMTDLMWSLWVDENRNGIKDAGENELIQNGAWSNWETPVDSLCVDLPDELSECHYILTVEDPCLCASDSLAIKIDFIDQGVFVDSLCAGDSILIGWEDMDFDSIRWVGDVTCDTCSSNWIITNQQVDSTYTLFFEILIFDQKDCNQRRKYAIVVSPRGKTQKTVFTICSGETITLSVDDSRANWMGPGVQETGPSIEVQPDTSSIYIVNYDEEACGRTDSFCVIVVEASQWLEVSGDTTLIAGDSIELVARSTFGKVRWFPSSGLTCDTCETVFSKPDSTITYIIGALDTTGCGKDTQITITIIPPPCDEDNIFIPNAFSPNGDQINDTWSVLSNYAEEVLVVVYNRWGEEIFQSTDINTAWDGTFEGHSLSPDVFAYYVRVLCLGGEVYEEKGNLTLFR